MTPSTNPARDEAVPIGWKLVPVEPTRAMKDAVSRKVDDFAREHARMFVADIWRDMLASAPAPAGGVDAVREAWSFLQDRLLEFEQEIGSGEEEREWAGHVHPALSRFNSLIASISPAATSGSEAGGEAEQSECGFPFCSCAKRGVCAHAKEERTNG